LFLFFLRWVGWVISSGGVGGGGGYNLLHDILFS